MATADLQKKFELIVVPASAFTLEGFSGWVHSEAFPDQRNFPETPKISFVQGQVIVETVAYPDELIGIHCPPGANTLEGFSNWVHSDDFPQHGKITFVDGRILIDMSPERYESHLKLKTEIVYALVDLIKKADLGEFYSDGGRIKNSLGGVSNEPDAAFATWATLESGKLAPPKDQRQVGKHVELVGTPDWVCEILSDSSIEKDTQYLRQAYYKAGIPEYWLIDARAEEIDFQLLVWQAEGYVAVADKDGWRRSPVFNREFRLTRRRNRVGNWQYELAQR